MRTVCCQDAAASVLPLQPIQLWYKAAQNVLSTVVNASKAMEVAELVDGLGRIGEVASEDAQVDGSAIRVDHFHHMQNVVGAPAADRICRMRTVCCQDAAASVLPLQPIQLWYKAAQNVLSTVVNAGKAMEVAELVDGLGRIGEVASEDAQVDGSAIRVDHFHHMQNVVGAPAADRICRMRTVCGVGLVCERAH